tara:strand:+ start:243 stop:980 length:738 start_codon:yes stop_codon:yes gene_type:complete
MLNWFSKKRVQDLPPISFSILKTDMHSHIIPKIDDGAVDMNSSINMVRKLQAIGFEKIVTTPHVMSDIYQNSTEIINRELVKVRESLNSEGVDIEIDAAAEYYIDYDFTKKIGHEKFLTFGDNYILVEFSFIEAPINLLEVIFKLQLEGYKVVFAHPERYSFFNKKDYHEFFTRGVFFQLNLLSLTGYYSIKVQEQAEWLISQNMISFAGTDCHNMNHANSYEQCQTRRSWHDLVESGKLLNSTL